MDREQVYCPKETPLCFLCLWSHTLHFHILTMNYQKEKLKKEFHYTIASKRIKYLRLNIPKEVKDLYLKNYKMLIKETEDFTDRKYTMFMGWNN